VQCSSALASEGGAAGRLCAVLRRAPRIVEALEAARRVDPPDWLLSAGAIRDAVWDDRHGRPLTAPARDIDVGFFDLDDVSPERDRAVEQELRAVAPDLPWQAKNQAAVHLWYPRTFGIEVPPFASCAEAIATFPETATCVGVRLLADDDMLVVAPYGLDDLFGCVCRHNPARVPASFYEQRVSAKGWLGRWPKLRYIAPATRESSSTSRADAQSGSASSGTSSRRRYA
jgi:uncharacterized protein